MEDVIEVTVLRHPVFTPDKDGGYVEARDSVTDSNFVSLITNNNYYNNYSAYNGTRSDANKLVTLMTYALPVIIIMGTIGNVLSFFVLVRCQMRNTSVYFYLLALAVADTSMLYVSAFKTWIRAVFGYELLHESDGACKVVTFLFLFWLHLSAWLIVFVTVDRFVVVWFPFKASSVCTVTRSRIATVALVMTIIVYNSHVFWTYHLFYDPYKRMLVCGPQSTMRFMFREFEYLKLASYSLIPFAIILVLNVAIITRLHWRPFLLRGRSGDTTSTFSGTSRTESATYGRQAKVTYMLAAVSLAWLVLTLPYAVHALVFILSGSDPWRGMFRAVSFLLMYTNHAINFYIYCITGKKFRRELEDLSKSACSRMRNSTNGSTVCSPSRKTHGPRTNLVDIELHDLVNT